MGSLQIDMLGTSFSIKANEDDEYLKKLLKYYTQIIDQITKNGKLTQQQVSIMAGIMLCDELYKEKSKRAIEKNIEEQETQKRKKAEEERLAEEAAIESKIEERMKIMIERLDTALLHHSKSL
ncbi:MAG: cell division protein ZapA [Treponema sp.]|nr:cell division protein ZapA [Treponema sp.]